MSKYFFEKVRTKRTINTHKLHIYSNVRKGGKPAFPAKIAKQIFCAVLLAVLCLSFSATVFADTDSVSSESVNTGSSFNETLSSDEITTVAENSDSLSAASGDASLSDTSGSVNEENVSALEDSDDDDDSSDMEDAEAIDSSSKIANEILKLLSGKTAAVTTGTPQDKIIQGSIDDVQLQYFNSLTDMALALKTGKVDFFVASTLNYYSLADKYPEFGFLDNVLATFDVASIFPMNEKGSELRAQMNQYLEKIRLSGELVDLQHRWLISAEHGELEIPASGENGVLHMATDDTFEPFSYVEDGKIVGYDIAIVAGFCEDYGYGLQIESVEFGGLISGISTGKYDIAAGQISWTEERAKTVYFSDSYYIQSIVPVVIADSIENQDYVIRTDKASEIQYTDDGQVYEGDELLSASKNQTLWDKIRRTLIDNNRWEELLHGLGTTLVITVASFVLANILGAVFCAMKRSKSKVLNGVAAVYSWLMQGMPIVVLLMILYYIIFIHSRSNILVAILGFGLTFGAHMAQLFTVSINGVDIGQSEAALASGLTRNQTFMGIVLPQAIRSMLPVYFGNLVSLMKGTAVVGYIAVNDLTKVGDMIRSNTYEAFIPLIIVAAIYFIITCLIIAAMNKIRKKLEPKRVISVEKKDS